MNTEWKEFLRQQGARDDGVAIGDFGNPTAERHALDGGNVLVDLSHFALIRAAGADTKTFLNGQLTNDVGLLDDGDERHEVQLSAWCSPKGRMLALFHIWRDRDGYLLQLPALLRDDAAKRLRMYVLRAKVTLKNADDQFVRIGLAGPNATSLLNTTVGATPSEINTVATSGEFTVLRLPGIAPRFEVLAAPGVAAGFWTEMKRAAMPVGAAAWTWHDVMAGIPVVLPATSDAFVPQMANLDLVGGVNFSKGCYTGQEIVARIHYRGRLKQRMYRARVHTTEAPLPGDSIYAPDMPAQSTGTVVISAAAPTEGFDLLAVIHCDSVDKGELRLGRADGARLEFGNLPYSFPTQAGA
jgi:tRNA-modifying protein YgfZ